MFAALGLFAAASTAAFQPILVDGMLCHPLNVLVKYEAKGALTKLQSRYNVVRTLPDIKWAVVQAVKGTLQQTRRTLAATPGIAQATFDRAARPAYEPNDPLWTDSWNLRALHVDEAWDITKGDPSVIVAVIDTGVFVDHPDLADNIWINPNEVPGNGIDDDANGYIDDVNGYDFAYGDSVPNDVYGHGTACAGLVAAVQDNNIGGTGVAPHCKVMALKASIDSGFFYDSNDAAAFLYAAHNGAKVLSMSFYSDRVSPIERDGIDYCATHGVVPVCAAGNDSTVIPYYPAAYENTLSVAALDGNMNKAGFSNFGSWVDVSSPGVGLPTTTNDGNYTTGFAGTSGACPQVAGVAALCFSANPAATNIQVRRAIEDSATLQSQAPFGEFANYGQVNAVAAVQRIMGGTAPNKPSVVRYVSRFSSLPISPSSDNRMRIYGRGLNKGSIEVFTGANRLFVLAQGRDWIDVNATQAVNGVRVLESGVEIANFTFPPASNFGFPIAEAATQGATLTGGFREALKPDGLFIDVSKRGDDFITMHGVFRRINGAQNMRLTVRRQFTNTAVGTETIQLYDWSSASYPYGNWVTISEGPVPTTMTTSQFQVPNFSRFLDDERSTYIRIITSDNLPNGTHLRVDQLLLDPVP